MLAAVKNGSCAIVFGGLHQTSLDKFTPLNDIFIMDLENLHWINPMIGGSIPPPIYSSSSYYYHID